MYYYRMVFHDWPWEDCRRILQNVKPAMTRGYSKLIINDIVIPKSGPTLGQVAVDLSMMAIGAEEKSEEQFKALLASENFKITKVWRGITSADAMIEAELAS